MTAGPTTPEPVAARNPDSLRKQATASVWQLMLAGNLGPGVRLKEGELSQVLGISRTPLREALLQLERDGLVSFEPRKGFRVKPASETEARELFSLRAFLEPLALRLGGIPEPTALGGLRQFQTELAQLPAGADRIERDHELHEMLIQHCPNGLLLVVADRLRRRAHWYARTFAKDATRALLAFNDQHEAIIASLEDSDLDTACRTLERNLEGSLDPVLSGLAAPSAGEPRGGVASRRPRKKILRVGVLSPVPDLDPDESFELGKVMILGQIFETPYAHPVGDEPPRPLLFAKPLVSHGSEGEGTVFSAAVRRGVRFSDGSVLEPSYVRQQLAQTEMISRQAAVTSDGDRIVFTLEHPVTRFDLSLTLLHCAVTLRSRNAILGTGPYMLDRESTPSKLRLVRNPYYRDAVDIDEVVFSVYPPEKDGRPERLITAIQAGEVDFTDALSRHDLPRIDGVQKWLEPGHSTAFLAFNTEKAALADPALRTALALAVDRRELARASYSRPETFTASGLLPPAMGGGDDGIRHDLTKAQGLMRAAGSPTPDLLRLLVVWGPRPYLPDPLAVAEILRRQIGRLGVEIAIEQPASRSDYLETVLRGDYDLVLTGHIPDTWDPADMLSSLLASTSVPRIGRKMVNEVNVSRFRNVEMDRALAELRSAPSVANRTRIASLMRREMPLLPLLYGPTVAVHTRRLQGFRPSIVGWESFGSLQLES